MPPHRPIYLATVCLERNRWASRQPSFPVSAWLGRWAADGFDGLELWENHYLLADPAEQARLQQHAAPLAIFNTYAGFASSPAESQQRAAAATALTRLQAAAVKYNLGPDPARLAEYRANLLAWADQLPPGCRLLCECHPGTVLEKPQAAAAFFAELDPQRFATIAHVNADPTALEPWLVALGSRVQHLHLQLREAASDPATLSGQESLAAVAALLQAHRFQGSASIEFTRGIGRQEQIETLYTHARADLAWARAHLG